MDVVSDNGGGATPVPRYRILVVDDNDADSGIVERHLRRVQAFSAAVAKAGSHEEGLRKLETEGADCVILDYRLGPQCGLDTLRAIRERGDDTAIIFVTGVGSEMIAVEALQCGAQDYLVKSVLSAEVLQRAVLNAIEKVALSRKLKEKQRELQDFVSVVAHDLQQPLSAVKGNVELIRDFYGARFDAQGLEFVHAAVRTADRMAEMIDALLGYARAGRDRAPEENLDLGEIVGAVRADLAELISRSRAVVEVDELPAVSGDAVTLAQLFQNLIANAIKFHGDHDPRIVVGGQRQGERALLWVRDNGMGIPEKSRETVFAPFRRLSQAKGRPGSGIGLATCKKIVEQHGGRIWVESGLGQGSTFYFTLVASGKNARPDALGAAGRVLIVDAEPTEGHALARVLESRGMTVFPAAGVEEAVSFLDAESFDALVVDLTLQDGDGMDLVRDVRRDSPGTVVLAVTAGDGRSAPGPLLAEARRQGADHVLPKPLDPVQVAQVLQRMISEAAPAA